MTAEEAGKMLDVAVEKYGGGPKNRVLLGLPTNNGPLIQKATRNAKRFCPWIPNVNQLIIVLLCPELQMDGNIQVDFLARYALSWCEEHRCVFFPDNLFFNMLGQHLTGRSCEECDNKMCHFNPRFHRTHIVIE
jgi:hypothetical protein